MLHHLYILVYHELIFHHAFSPLYNNSCREQLRNAIVNQSRSKYNKALKKATQLYGILHSGMTAQKRSDELFEWYGSNNCSNNSTGMISQQIMDTEISSSVPIVTAATAADKSTNLIPRETAATNSCDSINHSNTSNTTATTTTGNAPSKRSSRSLNQQSLMDAFNGSTLQQAQQLKGEEMDKTASGDSSSIPFIANAIEPIEQNCITNCHYPDATMMKKEVEAEIYSAAAVKITTQQQLSPPPPSEVLASTTESVLVIIF